MVSKTVTVKIGRDANGRVRPRQRSNPQTINNSRGNDKAESWVGLRVFGWPASRLPPDNLPVRAWEEEK
jgi:hypothetical protein